jgi:uroporphyrin-III C-methyltransferase/precorrin-2 dehydrogenase/sirohydrochlorin ferrochelatase
MSAGRKRSAAEAERFGALARLPVFFALADRRAVLAGGSAAAAWKAELLAAAGASVEVYAVDAAEEMLHVAAGARFGRVVVHRRAWTSADLPGAALAVGDFGDDDSAGAFSRAARAAGVPVNIVDRPAFCDFSFGAIVNRSPLVIGISTDGAAPAFAQAIRGRIEALLPAGFARWTAAAARWRGAVARSGLSFAARRRFWRLFATHALAQADDEPGDRDLQFLIAQAGAAAQAGSVTVVELERGDPDLLTLRAIRALQSADVVLFDDRIPHDALDFARREARKIGVCDIGAETDALLADLARQGKRVVGLACRNPRDVLAGIDAPHVATVQRGVRSGALLAAPAPLAVERVDAAANFHELCS